MLNFGTSASKLNFGKGRTLVQSNGPIPPTFSAYSLPTYNQHMAYM